MTTRNYNTETSQVINELLRKYEVVIEFEEGSSQFDKGYQFFNAKALYSIANMLRIGSSNSSIQKLTVVRSLSFIVELLTMCSLRNISILKENLCGCLFADVLAERLSDVYLVFDDCPVCIGLVGASLQLLMENGYAVKCNEKSVMFLKHITIKMLGTRRNTIELYHFGAGVSVLQHSKVFLRNDIYGALCILISISSERLKSTRLARELLTLALVYDWRNSGVPRDNDFSINTWRAVLTCLEFHFMDRRMVVRAGLALCGMQPHCPLLEAELQLYNVRCTLDTYIAQHQYHTAVRAVFKDLFQKHR